ncbi:hypothetical protein [Streptomyces mayteni]
MVRAPASKAPIDPGARDLEPLTSTPFASMRLAEVAVSTMPLADRPRFSEHVHVHPHGPRENHADKKAGTERLRPSV